ncbi:GDSL-type esterase/lipase family protein [Stutzerimonas stutzeri]|uniref:SGNH/GDSL hydrolase family protein n=1 Tax=Stutzerimonas stutzeri TaxID=316 RepID=UPI003EE2FC06
MTFNTGNPVPSTDARDFMDNVQNTDVAVNTQELTWTDRLGVSRKTFAGMEAEFDSDQAGRADRFEAFLLSSGYQDLGSYAAGLVITERNQVFRRDGEFYRAAAALQLPYTLTGDWAVDGLEFVTAGDAVLRQGLLASGGAALVGYGSGKVSDELDRLVLRDINPVRYGAVGNGTADDTAAFNALESAITGRVVDLGGKTYLVTSRPLKNTYTNGKFKYSGATRPAQESEGFTIPFGRYKSYGQQLELLKAALCNPFEQFTGIAFLGDSITWGATLPENLSPGSDLTTLATRRDLFVSPSFVNEFKRYIGKEYFDGATPVISNWPASTAGEAIATYTKNLFLYPNRAPFTFTASGTASLTDQVEAGSVTGYRAVLAVSAGSNTGTISMPNFTGEAFNMVFTPVASDAGSYELIVDGVSQGTFSTVPNGTTIIDGAFGTRINHTFPYVRNKTVEVRMSGVGAPSIRRLRIEAFEIPKTCRITNQGISGSNSTRYRSRALTTQFLPDIAVTEKDNFSFVQLGTNDRLDATWPNGVNSFEKQMADLFDILDPLCNSIVMVANHVSAANQGSRPITMQQIRGSLNRLAKARSYDFIDNYAIFTWADPSVTLADGLHPNALGHQMIYRNIVEALEQA